MFRRFTTQGRRELAVAAAAQAARGPLRAYYERPAPPDGTDVEDLRLLAVDLETTGLDPASDRMLSIGFVPVDGLRIDLSGAFHAVVRSEGGVGQSATVHGLTDDAVAAGQPVEDVLPRLLDALAGRVLLAHFARIEEQFLSAACRAAYGAPLLTTTVDTLELQRRIMTRPTGEPPVGSLRLPAARTAFHLPRYRNHNALTDALACAELYLAQAQHLCKGRPMSLASLR